MFFSELRIHFFRPLTGKYREQIVECLRLLHTRLYGANADYGEALKRDQVMEIFSEAITRAPLLEGDDDDGATPKSPREQASWILNLLVDHGWLERQVDHATFQSTYPFSRVGRLFTLPLVEADSRSVRTRHRNTRNTLNALEAFYRSAQVYDLLDAYEFSERIIADFTDVIAELEERKRELVREVETEQLIQKASEQFFQFMEQRFQPDVAIRLSADSVEKHRDKIQEVVDRIRARPKAWKATAERELRRLAPDLVADVTVSVLIHVLESIETRMQNAAAIMLPALRRTLQGFTRRADIIIRQLSYLHSQQHNDVVTICRELAKLPASEFEARMGQAGGTLASLKLTLVDPATVRVKERRTRPPVKSLIEELPPPNPEALRELAIQQLLDRAFTVSGSGMREYLAKGLGHSYRISTRHLPVNSAADLLALSHIIELGGSDQGIPGYRVVVEPTGATIENEHYFKARDEFNIELEADDHDS